jgi:hypothetical protein
MRIYEVVYTDENPDGSENEHGVVTLPAGEAALVQVGFPYEGRVGKIVCKQLSTGRSGGTAVAFVVAVYTTPVVDVGVGVPQLTRPDNAALYEAVPPQSGTAGSTVRMFTPEVGGEGFLFRNFDGDQTTPQRFCYVYIRPTSALTETKWEFSLGVIIDAGG